MRCPWCGTDPLYVAYHDEEWGVPVHDDRQLFELLILEGAQAGLSWITVLRKREAYREAFAGFDIARVAAFTEADHARLLTNPGLVRNRLKIAGATKTARAVLALQAEGAEVTTIEGLARDGVRHPLQDAFVEHHGLQCGFCTPGVIMTAVDLLERDPDPDEETIRRALRGNLCRCTGYQTIVESIRAAAQAAA